MIEERFLQSAVKIRRTYLKLNNNMSMYHNHAKKLSEMLKETVDRIDKIQSDVNEKKLSTNQSIDELLKLIGSLEKESKDLESSTDELNSEIEKLSKEEVELYRLIREKHPNLTDEQIVESVKQRLIEENIYYNN